MAHLIPRNFQDPVGLVSRLIRSRDPAALFAILSTGLAALAAPLDGVLARSERKLYAQATSPHLPIVIVTGAPRSGTTVVSQVLRSQLPVGYFNNLTAVFPRAPIVANRVFASVLRPRPPAFHSFYGRTRGFADQNDGLYLWDRWLGEDRYTPPAALDPHTAEEMRRFFAAYETALGKPLLTKNNAIATVASTIAGALPTAHFVYIRREPAYAAQSILHAREVIQGSRQGPYGVPDPRHRVVGQDAASPIEAVCAQLVYHERRMREQQRELGPSRFRVVEYEDFCHAPEALIGAVGREVFGVEVDESAVRGALPPFHSTNRVTISAADFDEIQRTLARLGA
ncbi:MAG TPA: sulfotransferase [Candidatus Binatia bacterium]|jgi:hypothetical protein